MTIQQTTFEQIVETTGRGVRIVDTGMFGRGEISVFISARDVAEAVEDALNATHERKFAHRGGTSKKEAISAARSHAEDLCRTLGLPLASEV